MWKNANKLYLNNLALSESSQNNLDVNVWLWTYLYILILTAVVSIHRITATSLYASEKL